MFDDRFITKDFTLPGGETPDYMIPALIVTPKTEGKTFILKEQTITPIDLIEIEEIKPGKIYLPRLTFQVNVGGITTENIENKYQESETGFEAIAFNVAHAFEQALPNGKGVFYQFFWMSQSGTNSSYVFTREVAMIWAEKIIST